MKTLRFYRTLRFIPADTLVRKYGTLLIVFCALGLNFGCTKSADEPSREIAASGQVVPNINAQPVAEDGQWPMPAKNYESTRFSGLDEINTSNWPQIESSLRSQRAVDPGALPYDNKYSTSR